MLPMMCSLPLMVGLCREIGLPMVRASAVNDDPRFVNTMADSVVRTIRRYEHARPLQIVRIDG